METGIKKFARVPFLLYHYKLHSNFCVPFCTKSQNHLGYPGGTLMFTKCSALQKNIKKFQCTDAQAPILPVLKEIKDIANGKEALQVLGEIADDVKLNPSAIEITKTNEFSALCNVILKDIRDVPLNQLVNLLKYVTVLQIPSDTMLVQTILQMLRVTINNLPVHQLPFLYYLLKQLKETPLVSALRTAVPLAFTIHIQAQEKDICSLKNAQNNFKFACHCANPTLIDYCLRSLKNSMLNTNNELTAEDYVSVYSTLSFVVPYTLNCIELLSTLQSIISSQMAALSVDHVHLLMKAVYKHRSDEHQPNNEVFIDALCNAIIQKNANFNICISFVQMLTDMNHNSIPLLDYIAGMSIIHGHLQNATFSEILCFLWALTTVDYKPVFWNDIKKVIFERNITKICSHNIQLRFAVALTALDCYYPELIERVFTIDTKQAEYQFDSEEMQLLLELYQGVKTLYSMYARALPDQNTMECITSLSKNNEEISLKLPLAAALGGQQYVKTKLKTKLGHIIDYVVVMGSNGQPIVIEDNMDCISTEFIEDMKTPSDSQTILIFNFPKEAYSNNIGRLNSRWQLKLNSVEALTGHSTLAINSQQWMMFPNSEKIPYLMQAIRLKCDNCTVRKN